MSCTGSASSRAQPAGNVLRKSHSCAKQAPEHAQIVAVFMNKRYAVRGLRRCRKVHTETVVRSQLHRWGIPGTSIRLCGNESGPSALTRYACRSSAAGSSSSLNNSRSVARACSRLPNQ